MASLPSSGFKPSRHTRPHIGTLKAAAGSAQAENRFPLKVSPNFQLARYAYAPDLNGFFVKSRKATMVVAGNLNQKENTMSQPAHKIRSGVLQVTIWRNHGERGNWYSVIPSRSYKQEDAWKETDSLGFDDLLTMAKLFDLAHSWIMHQQQADAKGRKEAAKAAA